MRELNALLTYGLEKKITLDLEQAKKNLIQLFKVDDFDYTPIHLDINNVLESLLDYAYKLGLFPLDTITERDSFEALIFDQIMPSPKQTKTIFKKLFKEDRDLATSFLFNLSKDVNYIKTERTNKNLNWIYPSTYGDLQITINLSKPEKDPKDIARALEKKDEHIDGVPKCVLCKENEQNYHNARMNLRIVPLELHHELWHFQYSPYAYYNEHAIILSDKHRDMKISNLTFEYLLDFVDLLPAYFIGSNADLPIVGGSILNHDHFQAGRHHFPIEKAKTLKTYNDLEEITISHLVWPLSTIRCASKNRKHLSLFADHILTQWKAYSNPSLDIIAKTNEPHQTITPILRKEKDVYVFDLILRNNRTTEEYPDGIFHPHKDVHHIKKENIGLIEAMGLAVLPARLKTELSHAYQFLTLGRNFEDLQIHKVWLAELKQKGVVTFEDDLYSEVGKKFVRVLEDAGVFKLDSAGTQAMDDFIRDCLQSFKI